MLSGLSLCSGNGHLGQLLYADDCLLVARASVAEVGVVSDVLWDYCRASGQRVNATKSKVIYGAAVPLRHWRLIKRVLNIC